MLKKYKTLIREGKIFDSDYKRSSGVIYSLQFLNENLIFPINDRQNSVYTSSITIHEVGHLFEISSFIYTGNNNFSKLTNVLPFYEVSSRFFEYAFLNYLKENNVYIEDTNMCLRNYFIDLFINSFSISIFYKIKNMKFSSDGYLIVEESDVIDYANTLMDRFNLFSLETLEGDMFDIYEVFSYGVGDLFSIFLYENYKEDPHSFKKEFRNALLTYPYTRSIDAFKGVGIDGAKQFDSAILSKVLSRVK